MSYLKFPAAFCAWKCWNYESKCWKYHTLIDKPETSLVSFKRWMESLSVDINRLPTAFLGGKISRWPAQWPSGREAEHMSAQTNLKIAVIRRHLTKRPIQTLGYKTPVGRELELLEDFYLLLRIFTATTVNLWIEHFRHAIALQAATPSEMLGLPSCWPPAEKEQSFGNQLPSFLAKLVPSMNIKAKKQETGAERLNHLKNFRVSKQDQFFSDESGITVLPKKHA